MISFVQMNRFDHVHKSCRQVMADIVYLFFIKTARFSKILAHNLQSWCKIPHLSDLVLDNMY